MRLKRIKLKNIRSYENSQIEFPEGSVLLAGDIGSGKTTILLAIEYALFGLQPGQRGSVLLRNGKDYGEVSLELEIDGREVKIERKLRRGSKTVSNDYSAIVLNGKKHETSITELKSKILELLNYPGELIKKTNLLYKFTVYTPQEEMKQIILEDSESRLNIIRHIFGVEKYKRIRENLSLLSASFKEQVKALQIEIKNLDEEKTRLSSIISFIDLLNEKIKEKIKDLDGLVIRRKEIESRGEKLAERVRERIGIEKQISKVEEMIRNRNERIEFIESEIAEINKQSSEDAFDEGLYRGVLEKAGNWRREIEKLHGRFIDVSGKMNSLYSRKKDGLVKKARIFKIDICPVCLQDVSENHKHNILNDTEKEIINIEKEIFSLMGLQKELSGNIDIKKSELARMDEQKTRFEVLKSRASVIEKSKEKLKLLENSKKVILNDVILFKKKIDELNENLIESDKFENLFLGNQINLKKSLDAEKIIEISLAELKKELEMTSLEKDRLNKEILRKEGKKGKMNSIIELNEWLSKDFLELIEYVERNIMIKLRHEFSGLFSKWFGMLAEGFEVHLDENFTPVIMHGEHELDYGHLSGGERTAVALAYRLALNQTINSFLSKIRTKDIVILDEPTDGFSELQLDKIRDVLEELKIGQLIIVSHEAKIEGFVDNVLRLKKAHGVSNIEN